MFFQVSISPQQKGKKHIEEACVEEDIAVLTLAPFSLNPKILFENVIVGSTVTKKLQIKNPNASAYELAVIQSPSTDEGFALNWTEKTIDPNAEVFLLLTWTPAEVTSYRDVLSISDNRNVVRDVPIVFKSIGIKKKNTPRRQKKLRPTVVAKTRRSPVKKISPKNAKKKISPLKALNKKHTVQASVWDNTFQLTPYKKQNTTQQKIYNIDKEDKENSPMTFQSPLYIRLSTEKLTFSEKINRLPHLGDDTPQRRETYCIKRDIAASPSFSEIDAQFNDSLENINFTSTPKIIISPTSFASDKFELKLDSDSFRMKSITKNNSGLKDTVDSACFDKNSLNNRSSNIKTLFQDIQFNDTYELQESNLNNTSGGTYIKNNVSSDTYVKDDSQLENSNSFSSDVFMEDMANRLKLPVSSPASSNKEVEVNRNSTLIHNNSYPLVRDVKLSCITEESESYDISYIRQSIVSTSSGIKRKQESTPIDTIFYVSPPKRAFITNDSLGQKNTSHNQKMDRVMKISKQKINSMRLTNNNICKVERLSTTDPFLMATIKSDTLSMTTVDPFMSSFYYDETWLDKLINELKKWLNAILTPPIELATNTISQKVDVAQLWQTCCKKSLVYAPTKEKVSIMYHTNNRLTSLRKSAYALFHSNAMRSILTKVTISVDKKQLSIRDDRSLHLDVGLQSLIMSLLLCYNPLWLRIGLETIYDEVIPLESNSDVMGLSTFLMLRFFRDPCLMSKNKHPNVNNMYLPGYSTAMKKFMLKKFLMLVYFLDQAKLSKLIPHDPCLFCKNASVKESRELLLSFARELLSAVGDITKYLRRFGYVVSHKQNYIDEFNYAVRNVGTDLRDGVRLVKVMEIILLRQDLTINLRVPAISRLQKIHNVKLAMDSLQEANYEIIGDITPKDIVDGNRDKTLSLLWQIIYKFQAPRFTNAAVTIQKWWRSLTIIIKRRILNKPRLLKMNAAIKIQRCFKARRLMKQCRSRYLQIKSATITMQKLRRSVLLCKKDRMRFLLIKKSVCFIQRKYRALKAMKEQRKTYLQLKSAVVCIQRHYRAKIATTNNIKRANAAVIIQKYFRATLQMKEIRKYYLHYRDTVIFVQNYFRAKLATRQQRHRFIQYKKSALTIQRYFRNFLTTKQIRKNLQKQYAAIRIQQYVRSIILMKKVRNDYVQLKEAAIIIQQRFRANKIMKMQREFYLRQKQAVLTIQSHFRATLIMREERKKYLLMHSSTVTIQKYLKGVLHMRIIRQHYLKQKEAVICIQKYLRATILMRYYRNNYLELRKATVFIQRVYRAKLLGKKQRNNYLQYRKRVILIQQKFKANLAMKAARKNYVTQRDAIINIQSYIRSIFLMRKIRRSYLQLKEVTISVQRKYRANLLARKERKRYIEYIRAITLIQVQFRATALMKRVRNNYLRKRNAAISIQRFVKSTFLMRQIQKRYLVLKQTSVFVQRKFRAKLASRKQRKSYMQYRNNVLLIQRKFRATRAMKQIRKNYLQQKNATITIQRFVRSCLIMKKIRRHYLQLKEATIFTQQKVRTKLLARQQRRNYLQKRNAVILIQRKFKATLTMKTIRENYLEQRNAAVIIQEYIRRYFLMKKIRRNYLQMKEATIFIQRKFRAKLASRKQREYYLKCRESIILIQQKFKAFLKMKTVGNNYLQQKYAAITIQQYFRSTLLTRETQKSYLKLLEATKIIQHRFRANRLMKKEKQLYLTKKQAVLTIQEHFKATLIMKKVREIYLLLRNSVLTIQKYIKAYLSMKIARQNYLEQRYASITIQKYYRAKVQMRCYRQSYLKLKEATIFIQRQFRANLASKMQRNYYQKYRNAVILIQQKFKATLIKRNVRNIYLQQLKAARTIQLHFRDYLEMKRVRKYYLALKKSTLIIQAHVRANLLMKKERQFFLKQKYAVLILQRMYRRQKYLKLHRVDVNVVIKIQSWMRMILAQRQLKILRQERKQYEEEMRRKKMNEAAIKIQSMWRAYRVRSLSDDQMVVVRQRTIKANNAALPEHTLGKRCADAIMIISINSSMADIIRSLTSLDFITRLCPFTCVTVGEILVERLYLYLVCASRSTPDMDACVLSTSILINLVKCPTTSKFVWKEKYLGNLLDLVLHWSDKDSLLCPYLCTLLWLFAQKPAYCDIIMNQEYAAKKLLKALSLCERRQKMLSRVRTASVRLAASKMSCIMPALTSDWGIYNKNHPRTFQNAMFGLKCLLKKLNISIC